MTNVLRVGVIGAGTIARFAHVPAYEKNMVCRLVAITDINEKARLEISKQFNIFRVYENAQEMIEKEELDAVSICTPPNTHFELVLECAKKGIHVLCEKPLALSVDDARMMVKECQKNGVVLAVGYTLRFYPNLEMVKERLMQGKLGQLHSIVSVYHHVFPKTRWIFDPTVSGGGVIMDLGSHVIDLHNWLIDDEIDELSVFADFDERLNVEKEASIILKYKNGITTMMSLNWLAPQETEEHYIAGSACMDIADGFTQLRHKHMFDVYKSGYKALFRDFLHNMISPPHKSNPWQTEIDDFISSIVNRRQPRATGVDGLKVTKIIEQIYRQKTTDRLKSSK
ncbi:Gfo/Idh/MocA family oxidoreductase [Candidatus Bathyarchaeota archaeon]|nr:Gfo/Idh/MocA family oxidoreductase [Candidatus Bathyarchaeota archaeon]